MKAIDKKLAELRKRGKRSLELKESIRQIKYKCFTCDKIKITQAKDYTENKVCRECQISSELQTSLEDILLDIGNLAKASNAQLTIKEYRQLGKYRLNTVYDICKKTWAPIVKDAVAFLETLKNKEEKEVKKQKEKNKKYICPKCNQLKVTYAKYYYDGKTCRGCSPSNSRIEVSDILSDVRRVVKELGYQPTIEQYKEYGKYGLSTIYRVCDMSWKEILASLGYKVLRRVHDAYPFQEVVAEMERVSKELGKLPTYSEYMELGKISATALRNATRETKWEKILGRLLNLDAETVKLSIKGNKEIVNTQLEKVKQIASKLGRSPSLAEASKYGVDVELLRKRLSKNWTEVLKQAGIKSEDSTVSSQYIIKNEDILSDINRVAKELGGIYPSIVKYEKLGYFLPDTIQYRFNTNWPGVIDLARSAAEKSNLELEVFNGRVSGD